MSWRTYVKKRSGPTKIFFGLRGSFRCGHKARKTLRKNWVFGVFFFFCWILYILNGRIWSKNFSRSQFQKSRLVSVRIIQKKKVWDESATDRRKNIAEDCGEHNANKMWTESHFSIVLQFITRRFTPKEERSSVLFSSLFWSIWEEITLILLYSLV